LSLIVRSQKPLFFPATSHPLKISISQKIVYNNHLPYLFQITKWLNLHFSAVCLWLACCFTQNDSTAQQWHVIRQGNGAYKIVNVASGLMDVRGGSRDEDAAVIQFHDKNGSNQQWYLTRVNA